jgi:Fe-S-cluster-containing hydrogenase component 2
MFNSYRENTLLYEPTRCSGCGMCTAVCPHGVFQITEFAGGAADLKAARVAPHGQPGRIVAAVLQAPQAVKNDGDRLARPDVPHNAAHNFIMWTQGWKFHL